MAIDRITPTRRPSHKSVGRQKWRDLLFLHWSVPETALRELVPKELELDLCDGQAFVGLVPFKMQGVQPWNWWPEPFAFEFLETNVRTYVHHQGRPGVYFFSLDAASWLAVRAARAMWSLPYFYAAMQARQNEDIFCYSSQRRDETPASLEVTFSVGEVLPQPPADSIEFYFLERYLLFTERQGRIVEGQVHHVPYPVRQATVTSLKDTLIPPAGLSISGAPEYAHFSPGVDVDIFGLRSLT